MAPLKSTFYPSGDVHFPFMWIILALMSAFLTALAGTISKSALDRVNSTVGLAIQTVAVLLFVWIAAFLSGRLRSELVQIEAKDVGILVLAGLVTALGYLCYFGALGMGDSSRVQPMDRLSLVFAVGLAALFLSEKLSPQVIIGAALMAVGAVVVALAPTSK